MIATSDSTPAHAGTAVINEDVLRAISAGDEMFDIVRRAVNIARSEQVQCLVKLRTRLLSEFSGMDTAVDEAIGFWSRHVKRPW